MEHTTLHLLYSRFWHKFLYDIGVVPTKEPYAKRTSHGMILGENGEKMSKSRGNVVNPDEIVKDYGADTMRLYEMFIGDFEKSAPWNTSSIKGCKRFLERTMSLLDIVTDGDGIRKELERAFNVTIKKVTEDIDALKFNTALASLMSLINDICDTGSVTREELSVFIRMLCPFAPHLCEEMWQQAGFDGDMTYANWPEYDESKTVLSEVEIAVQILGKVRGKLVIPADATQDAVLDMVKADSHLASLLDGKQIVKVIYVPKKLINIVAK
jgi:leucyl-tRNA synthetase